jgi:membrane protease YdiL (CAAX protease family)
MLIPAILLAALLVPLAWFARNDRAEYRRFKALTRTRDRQRAFRRWTIRSFLLFCGSSVAILLLLGRPGALIRPPSEFDPLSPHLDLQDLGPAFAAGLVGAVAVGLVLGIAIRLLLRRRRGAARPLRMLGDIEPLLPRNRDERLWTGLLAVNAGPSEELFFRLVLPLLIALVTGSAVFAFATAGLIFGLVHFYQGWVGIAATTFLGFVFTFFYLATGIIWVPVLLHSLINLNSLWLRPWLAARRGATAAQSPSR